jgi:hypothetical protein
VALAEANADGADFDGEAFRGQVASNLREGAFRGSSDLSGVTG